MSNPYQLGQEARRRNSDLSFNPYWKNQKKCRWMWELGWLEEDFSIKSGIRHIKGATKFEKEDIFMSREEVLKEIS